MRTVWGADDVLGGDGNDSRYVGLCLTHVLMRLPYGKDTTPVEEFDYEENVDGRDHSKYLWGNAAYAFRRFGVIFRPKHFAELTTPSAQLGWLRNFLLLRSLPLLFKRSWRDGPTTTDGRTR